MKTNIVLALACAGLLTGRPARDSAKFELDESKLQLSVYVMKGRTYSEVIVDHETGKVAATEAITGGEDLSASRRSA